MTMNRDVRTLRIMYVIILLTLFVPRTQAYTEQGYTEEQKPDTKPDFLKDFISTFRPRIKQSPADEPGVETDALPNWLWSWKYFKKQMAEQHGTSIDILLDDHHQHILNGPGSRKGRNIFWWNLTIKQKLWEDGKLIFKARGSNTDGNPPNGITPLVGSRLNLDWAAYETELGYIANLYIEQKLMNDKLLVAVGKITFPSYFDENKVAGWDFFSHSLARNQVFIHKYHTVGALGRYDLSDKIYVQAGITDVQGIRSETGLNTTFHGEDYFLTMAEMGIKTINSKGLEGNYRFDAWYDPQPLARHDGKGFERDTTGFGVSFDQAMTEKTGAFFRYGWDDGRVRKFSNYWSLGGTLKGPNPAREKDVLGFGIGQGITHQDYRRANNATHTETIFEAYYKIHMTDWYSITLDIQTLLNPGTNSHNDTSVIPGIRLKMLF
ncbi:MAG: carbohydrate porin [Sedimentisphaerales bacterium]|nr:carbohydrate porin [Sedimentisphaerales bacterium]